MSGFLTQLSPEVRRQIIDLLDQLGIERGRIDEILSGSSTVDHGALIGLGDNDHPQYALLTALNDEATLRANQDIVLQNNIDLKAPINDPVFTGIITVTDEVTFPPGPGIKMRLASGGVGADYWIGIDNPLTFHLNTAFNGRFQFTQDTGLVDLMDIDEFGASVFVAPTLAEHLTRKDYVDAADALKADITYVDSQDDSHQAAAEATAAAALTAHHDASSTDHDDRYYTEAESDARFANVAGDTFTGAVQFNSIITHLGSYSHTPTNGVYPGDNFPQRLYYGSADGRTYIAPNSTVDDSWQWTKESGYDWDNGHWYFDTALHVGTAPTLSTHAVRKLELDAVSADLQAHLDDPLDAHAATAISYDGTLLSPISKLWHPDTIVNVQDSLTTIIAEMDGRIEAGDVTAIIDALNSWTGGDPVLNESGIFSAGIITADAIASGAVVAAKIAASSIDASKIVASTITTTQIAANTILGGNIAADTITAANIAADTITASEIAANAITASEIAAGAVTTAKMTANTINGDRITANTLDAAKIVAGSITTDRMTANTIDGDRITAGTLDASKITAGSITTDRMTAGTIDADRLAALSITAAQISANAITATKLATDAITSTNYIAPPLPGDYAIQGSYLNLSNGDFQSAGILLDGVNGDVSIKGDIEADTFILNDAGVERARFFTAPTSLWADDAGFDFKHPGSVAARTRGVAGDAGTSFGIDDAVGDYNQIAMRATAWSELTGGDDYQTADAAFTLKTNINTGIAIAQITAGGELSLPTGSGFNSQNSLTIYGYGEGGSGNFGTYVSGPMEIDGKLTFPDDVTTKIQFYTGYEIGISGSTLWYNTFAKHDFRVGGTAYARITSGQVLAPSGSVTLPGFAFISDTNTGMYRIAENQLGIVTGGSLKARFDSSGTTIEIGVLYNQLGSSSAPSFTFAGDTNTGMYRRSTDQIGFTCGGADQGIIGVSYAALRGTWFTGSASGYYVRTINSSGQLAYHNSSIRAKSDVEDLELDRAKDVVKGARPVWYRSKNPVDRPDYSHYGLIAEEMEMVDPRFTMKRPADDCTCDVDPEGDPFWLDKHTCKLEVGSVDYPALVNPLLKVVADLMDRVDELEQQVAT